MIFGLRALGILITLLLPPSYIYLKCRDNKPVALTSENDRNLAVHLDSTQSKLRLEVEDTLKQVLFVHRHGDRTPDWFPPKDPLKSEPFWTFHGIGELTNLGKLRVYEVGKLYRQRYSGFLHHSVNKNQHFTRSSGKSRCLESAQLISAAMFGLDSPGTFDAKQLVWGPSRLAEVWQPSSITSTSTKIDGMLYVAPNCRKAKEIRNELFESKEFKKIIDESENVTDIVESFYGSGFDSIFESIILCDVISIEATYFPDKLSPKILELRDKLMGVCDKIFALIMDTTEVKRLSGGLLIGDIVKNMQSFSKNYNDYPALINDHTQQPKKLIQYSTHDVNLSLLLGMIDTKNKFPLRPRYASSLVFELHQLATSGEWFIKIFYMPQAPGEFIELELDFCSKHNGLCSLENFEKSLEKEYILDNWKDWWAECGNDLSDLVPYDWFAPSLATGRRLEIEEVLGVES